MNPLDNIFEMLKEAGVTKAIRDAVRAGTATPAQRARVSAWEHGRSAAKSKALAEGIQKQMRTVGGGLSTDAGAKAVGKYREMMVESIGAGIRKRMESRGVKPASIRPKAGAKPPRLPQSSGGGGKADMPTSVNPTNWKPWAIGGGTAAAMAAAYLAYRAYQNKDKVKAPGERAYTSQKSERALEKGL